MTTTPSLPSPPCPAPDSPEAAALVAALQARMAAELQQAGGWLGFDRFMELALYAPGLGYYANGSTKFGLLPQGTRQSDGSVSGAGSDFVTAPEMTPLFGYALAAQVAQALQATDTFEIWEFGAGTGALALQLLTALKAMGQRVDRYTIVDLSDSLKERQRHTLHAHLDVVHWAQALPAQMQGVVVGNEVLDAMPVQLLARVQGQWQERGVVLTRENENERSTWAWADRPTALRPPLEIEGPHDYLTETHSQGEAFVRTLGERLQRGAIFLLDYGFPEAEYYHPQRHMGTVMCHRAHLADADPLQAVGLKDITAHVNFTGIAVAAQEAGLELLGYTAQAHFLMNCGIVELMQNAPLPERVAAQKLILEHEMGELFKAIGLVKGVPFAALGFVRGDRSHRL
jgi:SAM-dependent MidA family methyltransferase